MNEYVMAHVQRLEPLMEGIKEMIKNIQCITHDGKVLMTWSKEDGVSESYFDGSTKVRYACDSKYWYELLNSRDTKPPEDGAMKYYDNKML